MLVLLVPIGLINAQSLENQNVNEQQISVSDTQDAEPIALYDLIFPDSNVSNETKHAIIEYLQSPDPPIMIPIPDNQIELGKKAASLIKSINSETDPQIKSTKQRQLDEMTIPMLRAGLVVAEKYTEDPNVWQELLGAFENNKDTSKITTVSHRSTDYEIGIKYTYSCYAGFIVCNSSWMFTPASVGELYRPTSVTLPSVASPGFLEPIQSVRYLGQHPPQSEEVRTWINVRSGSDWVAHCENDRIFTWSYNSQIKKWVLCSPIASGADRVVFHNVLIG